MYANRLDPDRLHAHRQGEAAQGFPLLRACPNTAAIKKLRYLEALDQQDQARLFEEWRTLAREESDERRAHEITLARPLNFPLARAYQEDTVSTAGGRDLGILPVKLVAGIRKDKGIGGLEGWASTMGLPETALTPTERFAESLDALVPAEPRRLRKAVATAAADRFAATAEKVDAERTYYTGRIDDIDEIDDWVVALDITFARSGGMAKTWQLDHQIWVLPPDGQRERIGSYEAFWGIPSAWDYITESGLDAAAAHLCNLASTLVALHRGTDSVP